MVKWLLATSHVSHLNCLLRKSFPLNIFKTFSNVCTEVALNVSRNLNKKLFLDLSVFNYPAYYENKIWSTFSLWIYVTITPFDRSILASGIYSYTCLQVWSPAVIARCRSLNLTCAQKPVRRKQHQYDILEQCVFRRLNKTCHKIGFACFRCFFMFVFHFTLACSTKCYNPSVQQKTKFLIVGKKLKGS